MISLTHTRKLLVGVLMLAVSSLVMTGPAPAMQGGTAGKFLQVSGTVLLNGTSTIAGAAVFSDSTITTGQNSSAVVSLGKLGRVEVLPDTTIELQFSDPGLAIELVGGGRVLISTNSNVVAVVRTDDGVVLSLGTQRNEFVVDTNCGNTFVSVSKGLVELRAGGTVKQIAAGNQDSAGTATPGCTPAP